MSMECHYGVWNEVANYYPEDIEHKEGMQKYLKYCKKNKIDINKIKEEVGVNEIEDIMKFMDNKNKNREAR